MRRFAVIVAPSAGAQIEAQMMHIAADSIDHALAWEARLADSLRSIGETPGHAVDEEASDRLGFVVRKTIFEGTYLIHYVVDEIRGEAWVVNFRHGARLPRRGEP